MKRIKISARLQKETEKAYVFTSSSPRTYKGEFTNKMFTIPKSQVTLIERTDNDHGIFQSMILDLPEWLFNKLPIHEPEFAQHISVI